MRWTATRRSRRARGRIAIASALARGLADPTAELRAHLDHCLGCLNCETVCPAQVQYGELLAETRALLGPSPQRPRWLLELVGRPCCACCANWVAGSRCRAGKVRWRGACLPLAATLDPQLLLSSNIGCRLHLAAGIDAQGLPWPTRHPLTLLAQQLEQPPSNQESP